MKRIIRESFRQARGRLPAVDLVVIARPLKSVDNNALRASLEKQWRRIGKAFDTQE
jgi:ribonuclease P protein component